MKRLGKILLASVALAFALWAALPGVPGRLLFSALAARSTLPLAAEDPRLYPNLDFTATRIAAGAGGARLTAGAVTVDPELRLLLRGIPEALFDVRNVALAGTLPGGDYPIPFAFKLPRILGKARGGNILKAALQADLLDGTLHAEAERRPRDATASLILIGSGFDLDRLWPMIPLSPLRVHAKVKRLSGLFTRWGEMRPEGSLTLELEPGSLETLVGTTPVLLEPTGFGDAPAQLGLSNDRASVFSKITAEVKLSKDGSVALALALESPHYRLDAAGTVDRAGAVDGRLTLALPPATLAGNTLGLDFRGEVFHIYGTFRGPLDDVQALWDVDKEALLRGASDLLRGKVKGWLKF